MLRADLFLTPTGGHELMGRMPYQICGRSRLWACSSSGHGPWGDEKYFLFRPTRLQRQAQAFFLASASSSPSPSNCGAQAFLCSQLQLKPRFVLLFTRVFDVPGCSAD